MERAGTPAILLCTTPFRQMAATIVKTKGLPTLRMIEVEHPLGGIGAEEFDRRVDQATDLARELLQGRP